MPQNEAEGRLNLYDDVTPLENTNKISVLVDAIRKKTKGADVREAIARGMEITYDDAAKSGNTDMEVVKSRGTYNTLPDRLDNVSKNLDGRLVLNGLSQNLMPFRQMLPRPSLAPSKKSNVLTQTVPTVS